jgi:peptidoglycan/LPS O-acetylase OafA/YrhL
VPAHQARLAELDSLRGVAVLMVLAFHYTTRFGELFPHVAWGGFALGGYGVHVFFLISGFVIVMTLERSEHAADFLVGRFSRLYPAYWSAILLTSGALWLAGGPLAPPSAPQAAVNLTMLQGFFGVPSVDGAYWSLQVELLFYAMALAAFTAGMLRSPLLVPAWLVASAVYASPLWTAHLAGLPHAGLAARLLALEFAPYFAIGILFYRLYRRQGSATWSYVLIGTALVLVARTQPPEVALLIAAASAVLWKLVHGGVPLLRFRPLVFVGTISYPLYLLHQKIGHALLYELAARGWSPLARVAATVAAALALATLVTFLIERPAMRAIRRWYRARPPLPAPPRGGWRRPARAGAPARVR